MFNIYLVQINFSFLFWVEMIGGGESGKCTTGPDAKDVDAVTELTCGMTCGGVVIDGIGCGVDGVVVRVGGWLIGSGATDGISIVATGGVCNTSGCGM